MKEFMNPYTNLYEEALNYYEREYYERKREAYDTCFTVDFTPVDFKSDSRYDVINIAQTWFNLDDYLVYRYGENDIEKILNKVRMKIISSGAYARIQLVIRYQSRANKEKVFTLRCEFNPHDYMGISETYVESAVREQFNKMLFDLLKELFS